MKRYTIGILLFQDFSKVLLIKKTKPEWQAGKLNFPGGKLEPNELQIECVVREFYEETNLSIPEDDWKFIGVIQNQDEGYEVDIFTALYNYNKHGEPFSNTEEEVMWCHVNCLPPNVISNLRWLIPFGINCHQQGNYDVLKTGVFTYKNS